MTDNLIQTATKTNAVVAPNKKQITDLVKAMEPEIKKALPSVITPERFTRIALTTLSSNPKLQQCTPMSFIGAMMQAAQLGVECNTQLGQAYLIPYSNKGKMEAQFQLGYKGLIDLAYRSGEVSIIQAHEVCENDDFSYELGLDPKLHHVPATKDRGEVIAYYAVFKTKDGGYGFEVMSKEDITKHAKKYSKSFGYGPWKDNFDEMAKKTVLKRVLKYAPLKSDFARAVATDETIKTEISDDMYSVTDTTAYEEASFTVVESETGEVIEG